MYNRVLNNPCGCGYQWRFDAYCPHSFDTKYLFESLNKCVKIEYREKHVVFLDEDDFPVGMVNIKEIKRRDNASQETR